MTPRERIREALWRIRNMPEEEKRKPLPRAKYRWGAKDYLASFEIGETRICDPKFKWNSIRSIACVLKRQFGCSFIFWDKKFIKRIA